MQLGSSTWSDLRSEYYHNLKTLQTSIIAAQNSTVEMNKIFSETIKKSKNSSPETMQKFFNLWFEKSAVNNLETLPEVNKSYKRLKENPTEKNFQDFGFKFQNELHQKSIAELESYQRLMVSFYHAWKEMWPH